MLFRSYRGRGAFATWPEASLIDYVQDGFRERPDGSVELSCAPDWEASNFADNTAASPVVYILVRNEPMNLTEADRFTRVYTGYLANPRGTPGPLGSNFDILVLDTCRVGSGRC